MELVLSFSLLVTLGYLVVASGYLVVTSGYLILTTVYLWLLLGTSCNFRFLVLRTAQIFMCCFDQRYHPHPELSHPEAPNGGALKN